MENKELENSLRMFTSLHSFGRLSPGSVAVPLACIGVPSGSATEIPGCCFILWSPSVFGVKKWSVAPVSTMIVLWG